MTMAANTKAPPGFAHRRGFLRAALSHAFSEPQDEILEYLPLLLRKYVQRIPYQLRCIHCRKAVLEQIFRGYDSADFCCAEDDPL